jgi:hypothetical protein
MEQRRLLQTGTMHADLGRVVRRVFGVESMEIPPPFHSLPFFFSFFHPSGFDTTWALPH